MNLFFNAENYLQHIESPRVSNNLSNKEQCQKYLSKYIDSFYYDYLEDVIKNSKSFVENSLTDDMCDKFIEKGFTMEVAALRILLDKLTDFCNNGGLTRKPHHTVITTNEAFDMFCKLRTKLMELDAVSKKTTEKEIREFHKKYM